MRIIGVVSGKNSGCGYHRITHPLMNMEADVYITNVLKEEDFEKGCDVLFYNRLIAHNTKEEINEWKKKYKFKIILDIDDSWILDYFHILKSIWDYHNIPNQIINNIIEADVVTTTHERLADLISAYNKSVYILPNAISGAEQFSIQRIPSEIVRLFWSGSITHRKDIEILRNPMKRIGGLNIATILAGYQENQQDWSEMVSAFTNGLKIKGMVYKGVEADKYYHFYAIADICLIPLVDTSFNSMKSNLKVLEAANLGIPCVVSNVNPYKDLPVSYVNSQKDWFNHVKDLVNDSAMRHELGMNLKNYCEKNYNFVKINEKRKQIFHQR